MIDSQTFRAFRDEFQKIGAPMPQFISGQSLLHGAAMPPRASQMAMPAARATPPPLPARAARPAAPAGGGASNEGFAALMQGARGAANPFGGMKLAAFGAGTMLPPSSSTAMGVAGQAMPRFPNPLPQIQQTWKHVAENSTPAIRAAATVPPGRLSTPKPLPKVAADLSPAARADLPKKDFAVSAGKSNTGERAYPIPDRQHAKSALGFAKMHGDSADLDRVRAKVRAKFPDMLKKESAVMEAVRSAMGKPGVAGHLTDLAGLGILAAPAVDELQAHARAGLAGQYNKEGVKSREALPHFATPLAEATGLGVLMAPEASHLLGKLRGAPRMAA
jgi:hypothetical protein